MANKWPSQEVDRIPHHSHRVTSIYSWIIILEIMEFSVQETLMFTSSNFLCKKPQNNNICPKCTCESKLEHTQWRDPQCSRDSPGWLWSTWLGYVSLCWCGICFLVFLLDGSSSSILWPYRARESLSSLQVPFKYLNICMCIFSNHWSVS